MQMKFGKSSNANIPRIWEIVALIQSSQIWQRCENLRLHPIFWIYALHLSNSFGHTYKTSENIDRCTLYNCWNACKRKFCFRAVACIFLQYTLPSIYRSHFPLSVWNNIVSTFIVSFTTIYVWLYFLEIRRYDKVLQMVPSADSVAINTTVDLPWHAGVRVSYCQFLSYDFVLESWWCAQPFGY
jgi:hypothetical protein